jgi:hypothetical protein
VCLRERKACQIEDVWRLQDWIQRCQWELEGGRTRHEAGYVMVRYLVEGDSVHHINGIRDDNRLRILKFGRVHSPQASG